mmetsp:Transcript_62267/g.165656  ORF Transcript_62267/g.165656 Transcript_62267/m.165656 type:complete len:124 (+) Transcript_62267:3-374(+)
MQASAQAILHNRLFISTSSGPPWLDPAMQASAQAVLFLLFCCAAQPGSSVSVSERWPWSKKKNAQPAAAEAPMQKQYLAPGPAPAEDVLSELTQAGCYMRMPSGCPKAPMRTELWRHDGGATT